MGARKLIAEGEPRKVLAPCDEPIGCTKPFGEGLLRVPAVLKLVVSVAAK